MLAAGNHLWWPLKPSLISLGAVRASPQQASQPHPRPHCLSPQSSDASPAGPSRNCVASWMPASKTKMQSWYGQIKLKVNWGWHCENMVYFEQLKWYVQSSWLLKILLGKLKCMPFSPLKINVFSYLLGRGSKKVLDTAFETCALKLCCSFLLLSYPTLLTFLQPSPSGQGMRRFRWK